jgi:hypothetical protein
MGKKSAVTDKKVPVNRILKEVINKLFFDFTFMIVDITTVINNNITDIIKDIVHPISCFPLS